MEWQAVGTWILAIKGEPIKQKHGFELPGESQEKPTTCKILSVGGEVGDKAVKDGMDGIFIAGSGFMLEVDGQDIMALNDKQIVAVK